MVNKNSKTKLTALFTFAIFISVVVFGFIFMMDMGTSAEQSMSNVCPFTILGGKICPTDASSLLSHHISVYQSFSNALISKNILGLIMLALIVTTLWLLNRHWLLKQESFFNYLTKRHFKNWRSSLKSDKKTNWLALLVNSPSFALKA